MKALLPLLAGLYLFLWVGGLAAYLLLGGPPAHVAWTGPLFLLAAGLLVLLTAPGPRAAALLLAVGALGFAAELAGVHTGLPFGSYRYTEALGPRLWGVPPVLAAAWWILAAHARDLARRLGLGRLPGILLGALWMTAVDLVIDPLAAGPLGYWRWAEGGLWFSVPASNFLGWLGVSALALAVLGPADQPHPGARWVGTSVLLFFSALAAGLGLPVLALLGLGLVGADLWVGERGARVE